MRLVSMRLARLRPAALAPALALALPLALGLAACHKDADGGAGGSGSDPVAKVAPPAGKAWSDVVEATPDHGMRMGNPKAGVKLIEYGSLTCPHCAHFATTGSDKLIAGYVDSGQVSWEFRSFAIHPQDVPLTVLVRCAPKDSFFGLVEQLYVNQPDLFAAMQKGEAAAKAAQALPPAQRMVALADAMGMTDFFAARGLPVNDAHACLADTGKAAAVAKEAEDWGNAGIDSTPTFVVNGSKADAHEWAELETILKAAGAR